MMTWICVRFCVFFSSELKPVGWLAFETSVWAFIIRSVVMLTLCKSVRSYDHPKSRWLHKYTQKLFLIASIVLNRKMKWKILNYSFLKLSTRNKELIRGWNNHSFFVSIEPMNSPQARTLDWALLFVTWRNCKTATG